MGIILSHLDALMRNRNSPYTSVENCLCISTQFISIHAIEELPLLALLRVLTND